MLVFALVWPGWCGTLDGLFFTVMPVLAIQQMWEARGVGADGAARYMYGREHGRQPRGHCCLPRGFVECCSTPIGLPLIGNAIITSGSLVTGNAITPPAHIAMHMAAVLHGMETHGVMAPALPLSCEAGR